VVREVVVQKEEVGAPDVLDVLEAARIEVVDADDAIALSKQEIAKVRAEEAGPPGNDCGAHRPCDLS
jgi:hypothetical protein